MRDCFGREKKMNERKVYRSFPFDEIVMPNEVVNTKWNRKRPFSLRTKNRIHEKRFSIGYFSFLHIENWRKMYSQMLKCNWKSECSAQLTWQIRGECENSFLAIFSFPLFICIDWWCKFQLTRHDFHVSSENKRKTIAQNRIENNNSD